MLDDLAAGEAEQQQSRARPLSSTTLGGIAEPEPQPLVKSSDFDPNLLESGFGVTEHAEGIRKKMEGLYTPRLLTSWKAAHRSKPKLSSMR